MKPSIFPIEHFLRSRSILPIIEKNKPLTEGLESLRRSIPQVIHITFQQLFQCLSPSGTLEYQIDIREL